MPCARSHPSVAPVMARLVGAAAVALMCVSLAAQQTDRRLPAPPAGVQRAQAAQRLAVVVGNNAYPDAPLRNALPDARAVARALRDLGFTVTELTDARIPEIERALTDLAAHLGPSDEAVFYFAGHGTQIENENYLFPVDFTFAGADEAGVKYRAFPAGLALDRLARARVRVVILDACRDNPFVVKGRTSGGRGLAGTLQATGALVAYATAPGDTASDNPTGPNGLFTTHLLDALSEPGLPAVELFRLVRERVYKASGGRQVPWLSDGLIGEFVFNRAAAALANLTVRTEPAGATVFVDGQMRGAAAPELVVTGLAVGEHQVAARREGYAEARETVRVAADAAPVVLRLHGTSGALRIETTPVGAQVLVDGIARGTTPLEVAGLAPGAHRVEATLSGSVPYYGDVEVRAGETATVRASLAPAGRAGADAATGILHVASDPPGAQVYLDGALIGTTPHTQEAVPVGPHTVRVVKQYYRSDERRVEILPKTVTRQSASLTLNAAELVIESDLGQGTLWVGERQIGPLQPTQSVKLTAGVHRVRVQHPTAGDIVQEVELVGGAQKVTLRKAAHLGAVTVLSDVAIDRLVVAGRVVSELPPVTVADVPRGPADVVAVSANRVARKRIDVVPGDTAVVRLDAAGFAQASSRELSELSAVLLGIRWSRIPAGTFQMGCVPGDAECASDEKPRHQVTLTKVFELMTTEVTVGMWKAYARSGGAALPGQPDWSRSDDHPVVNIDWPTAQAFCRWVGGRLPTEAEWEYGARGGREGLKYPWGNDAPVCQKGAPSGARFDDNGGCDAENAATRGADPVGSFAPNGYGLYDMAGNVWEWVSDWYVGSYPGGAVTDPSGPSSGQSRVVRGGSWFSVPRILRASFRSSPDGRVSFVGLRCARDVLP